MGSSQSSSNRSRKASRHPPTKINQNIEEIQPPCSSTHNSGSVGHTTPSGVSRLAQISSRITNWFWIYPAVREGSPRGTGHLQKLITGNKNRTGGGEAEPNSGRFLIHSRLKIKNILLEEQALHWPGCLRVKVIAEEVCARTGSYVAKNINFKPIEITTLPKK